jgi:UDP-glucose 4-epimerase
MVFQKHNIDAVVHFAGLKAVGESIEKPLVYYRNNIDSTLSLLETMEIYNVKRLIFSSSATVYGDAKIPYIEDSQTGKGITNPYGRTKFMIEEIIKDVSVQHPENTYVILRYFNPVGAHESGLIGEDPKGPPNNLMPFISQVASGRREYLSIFGNNYNTPDGTCIRDYIHVTDLATGHVVALSQQQPGCHIYNLGSGVGTSVIELVRAFGQATGVEIPYVIKDRRPGDLDEFYANPKKARDELDWTTTKTIQDMCRDTWKWQSENPYGYSKTPVE